MSTNILLCDNNVTSKDGVGGGVGKACHLKAGEQAPGELAGTGHTFRV